jgi:UDP-MurNAc hydroxylase
MNKVTFLGQAGIFVEYKDLAILCDPWLSKTGGFLASWHQFPKNESIEWKSLRKATHLYVSHRHQDHFDREFLRTLPNDIEVLCPNHLSGTVWKKMRALGFKNIALLGSWQTKKLGRDVTATMILDPVKYLEDSSLLLELGAFKLLDKNDCQLGEEYSKKLAERSIDLLFAQFSGAQYYPVLYEYGLKEKQQKIDLFVSNLKSSFKQRVNWISPKVVVPSAGPACFLDQDVFHLNFGSIFPDAIEFEKDVADGIGARYEVMTPGQALTIPEMKKIGDGELVAYENKKQYLLQYSKERKPIIHHYISSIAPPRASLYNELKKHLEDVSKKSEYLTRRVNCLVRFEITGINSFDLYADFRSGEMLCSRESKEPPNYVIKLDSKYLNLILNEELSWEDFFLSMRLSLKRNPDVYNWPLFALLRFGYSKPLLKVIEQISIDATKESFIVDANGSKYEIQRYCPHAGEDLKKATVENGTITCCRHFWSFDLETGKCLSGGNADLKTKKLAPEIVSKQH